MAFPRGEDYGRPVRSLFIAALPRDRVEAGDLSPIKELLGVLTPLGKEARGSLMLTIDGYEDTPEEVYEIPAIRTYMRKVADLVPHILYLLHTEADLQAGEPSGASIFAECIGNVVARSGEAVAHLVPKDVLLLDIEIPVSQSARLRAAALAYAAQVGDPIIEVEHHLRLVPGLAAPKTS